MPRYRQEYRHFDRLVTDFGGLERTDPQLDIFLTNAEKLLAGLDGPVDRGNDPGAIVPTRTGNFTALPERPRGIPLPSQRS